MIPARHSGGIIHSLLNNRPVAFPRNDKRMQVQLETVLYSGIVNLSAEFTATHQFMAIHSCSFGKTEKLRRCFKRMFSFSAANINPEFIEFGIKSTFQSAHHRSSNS